MRCFIYHGIIISADSYTYTQQQPSYAGQTNDVSGEVDGSSRVKGGRMNQMMYDDEDEEEDEEESHDGDSEEEEEQDGQNPIQRTLLGYVEFVDNVHVHVHVSTCTQCSYSSVYSYSINHFVARVGHCDLCYFTYLHV